MNIENLFGLLFTLLIFLLPMLLRQKAAKKQPVDTDKERAAPFPRRPKISSLPVPKPIAPVQREAKPPLEKKASISFGSRPESRYVDSSLDSYAQEIRNDRAYDVKGARAKCLGEKVLMKVGSKRDLIILNEIFNRPYS
jgi:hypothetical protein